MPGKVNPVLPEVVLQVAAQVIGNDTAITIGGMQGQFELNVRIPLIARNLLGSIHLLTTASTLFAEKCIDGIQANEEGAKRSAESTLAAATALNPHIGYDKAGRDRQGRRPRPGATCARSRSSTASTRTPTRRRWTCARWRAGRPRTLTRSVPRALVLQHDARRAGRPARVWAAARGWTLDTGVPRRWASARPRRWTATTG